ncbi:protein of unknown function DUF1428 [Parvibaculum lavamentivorans DS-1]|uniref:RNA signal recognition particle 4.5S RNA n=1 Tax=Parvibaculum lavamentivorans (strain DS-1 / DSM 13023 / NCIMB 13966) TaxID=402881 RepID=A7HVY2_PARL1|nr:DUF1428 domain-containing protein [Parvibaculum lavamentivorans]ABS64065.1 protein of unknown function DUF1428 [Parvibaculum lavamentivorans DS-1]
MSYVEGFLVAVPAANKELYRKHAQEAWSIFAEFGMSRLVEGWGDDVPDGKVTDFKRAVELKPDEVALFSWFELPSKEVREAANQKLMTDPRMQQMGQMPFDGMRMVFGGFSVMVDEGPGGKMGHIDGYVLAVPKANKEAYREMAAKAAPVFLDHGATRVVECWEDDVKDGKVTDFRRAVKATKDEAIVFSWVEWPSKEAREKGWPKLMEDERMKYDPASTPFDGQRMIYGTFTPIVDETVKGEKRKTA